MGGAACRSQQVMLLRIIITVSNAVEHEAAVFCYKQSA